LVYRSCFSLLIIFALNFILGKIHFKIVAWKHTFKLGLSPCISQATKA